VTTDTVTRSSQVAEKPDRGRDLPVLAWVLRTSRRTLIGWSLAMAAVSAIYASFWSAMGDATDIEAFVENLPEGLVEALGYDQIATPAGYLESTILGFLGPILLLVFAVSFAATVLAGEEESGTLELELTLPVTRRRVALERYLALVVHVVVLVTVVTTVIIVIASAQDMGLALGNIAATGVQLAALVLAIATVAFAAGAATGRRAVGVAVGAGLGVLAFIADALSPLLDGGAWLSAISPFGWYLGGDPLNEGLDPVGLLLLLGLAAVALVVAVVTFERRDLGV
jgi:ABC-2 type transport system permease protein